MEIVTWKELDSTGQARILARPGAASQPGLAAAVTGIIDTVRKQGDQALYDYASRLEGANLNRLTVSAQEYEAAEQAVSARQKADIEAAIQRLRHYHQEVKPREKSVDSQDGVVCRRMIRPIARVGLYVPGGSAPLVSTLMMLAIPAEVAGCPHCVVCTPPDSGGHIHPLILVTARLCGVQTVYKAGGAQAVAALAYGTESVLKVDKIYGPGNAWVTEAKQQVAMRDCCVGIDMPAGPSEVLVLADEQANPRFVAADLLAQAEHGGDSQAILVTNSNTQASAVAAELEQQRQLLGRQAILGESLSYARIIVTDSLQEALTVSNRYAPEHLILQLEQPEQWVEAVTAAGSVFVGPWAPETLGDYVTGSNHVLPTYGYATHVSGLSTADYLKTIPVQSVSREGLCAIGPLAMALAETEGLDAHQAAVRYRLDTVENAHD